MQSVVAQTNHNKLKLQRKINDTVICLRMGKTWWQKPHRVIFRSPLLKFQSDLFCNDSSPFWCTAPKYVTNQLRGSQYATSITNLKIFLAAKFFSSSTQWRLGRCLVTKPYGANTQQLLQERDELGQELCLRSQFSWTEFAQCLCNLCTV